MEDWELNPFNGPELVRTELKARIEKASFCHHTEHLVLKTMKRYGLYNINDQIEEVLMRSKIQDGFCYVGTMHITAGIYMNDAESGLLEDISTWLSTIAPYRKYYRHHQTGEDNADAHLKSYITNHFLTTPVTHGKLDLGTWQRIFYAEFDGKREKRLVVKITGFV